MPKPSKTQTYKHAENISWRKVGADGVLLNLDTSAYYSLNEVGVLIWERIGMGDDAEAVTQAVCGKYDREPALVRKDVDALIKDLLAKGLLLPA
jgi:hypothetical protein